MRGSWHVKVANMVIMTPKYTRCFFWYVELSPTNSKALAIENSGALILFIGKYYMLG